MRKALRAIEPSGRRSRKSILAALLGVSLLISLSALCPAYGQPRGFALFVPRVDSFWEKSIFLARNAAAELGVPLEVYDAKGDPRQMVEQVRATVRKGIGGIIFPAFQGTGKQILETAEEYKVPSILIVSGIPDILPQTKYRYLKASILPNDEKAGTLLIRQLVEEAERKGLESIHVLAIQGNPQDLSSKARLTGLTQYLKNLKNVATFKTVTGDWDLERSYQAFKNTYQTHPEVNVVWCVNDRTALGVVKAIDDLGIQHTVLVGGMDWDKDALLEIGQGRMQVSVGGHFLAGAWAVVLLYDYLNGFGFLSEGPEIEAEMVALSGRNLHHFTPILSSGAYPRNFSQFSKAQNPSQKLYRFDLQKISAGLAEPETGVHLTEKEKAWLAEHKRIRMGVDPNYAPYALVEGGQYEGVSADFVQMMSENLGITMEMVPGPTISEMVEGVRNRTLDLITTIRKTPEREQFMNFTQSYIPTPLVIVTRKDYGEFKRRDDIAGKKVALVKDWSSSKKIVEQFPTVQPYWVSEPLEALRALSTGQADVYVGSEGTISYLVAKNSITNLKMASVFEEGVDGQRFGVRKDWPELVSILDKALESIPERKRLEIMSKWISLGPAPEAQKALVLTEEEMIWLSERRDIRLGVDPNRLPFEFLDANKVYAGIASDYVRIINDRLNTQVAALSEYLNIHIAPVPDLTWAQVLEKAKTGEIDVIPCITRTPEREKSYLFTKPYVSFPMVIVTRQDAPFVNGIKDFADNRVAVIKGYATRELLEKDFPGRRFFLAADWEEALQALSKGKVDAFVENLASITYITQKLGLTNLKVAATMPYSIGLSLAVRKDWPTLVTILDKALDSISESEKASINNRWINVRFEREVDWSLIYKIVIPIVLVGGLLLVIFAAWTRSLSKEVTQRKRAEKESADAEERSRLILESASEGIIGVEPNGKITFVNPSSAHMLGYSTEELVGRGLHDLVHHSRADGSPYPREDCPMYESYTRGKANRVDNEVLWRKDGSSFPVEYASTPVTKEGTVVGAVVTFRDITERKKMDAELKEYVTDLERFNRLVIGREEKMIQLKEEINGLMEKLGEEKKYKIVQ